MTITEDLGYASDYLYFNQNRLSIEDLSNKNVLTGRYTISFKLSDGKEETKASLFLTIKDKIIEPVEVIEEEKLDEACQVTIKTPNITPSVVYKSGSSPVMIRFNKFELVGSEECKKGQTMKLNISTDQQDSRFAAESDWV